MTVRWKPLLILSGLFLVIAIIGVAAIAYTLIPRGSSNILRLARADRAAKHYDKAEIQYRRALQADGKNAAIYEEMASLYAEWAEQAPAAKKAELQAKERGALVEETKHGKTLREPRKKLLSFAMGRDELAESLYWAKETLTVEPNNPDAHFVLASVGLDERQPNIPEVKRHLTVLEAEKAPAARVDWIKARLAEVSHDGKGLDAALRRSQSMTLPAAAANTTDRIALLRLRALDLQTTNDPETLPERVLALQNEARTMLAAPALAPALVTRLSVLLERAQRLLSQRAARVDSKAKATLTTLIDGIEGDVESLFQKTLTAPNRTDLRAELTYADHLRYREKRDRCLEVIEQALKSPLAGLASQVEYAMSLRVVAIETTLANVKDEKRFEKAAPHIKALLATTSPRYQGLGHLFQGAIDLEQSGTATAAVSAAEGRPTSVTANPKLRASALNHLKLAAAQLPEIAEAQARYGVALVLAQEPGMGRQYLQNALRLGNLDPQYQVWAAWSMLQAGYPEEAEPIVAQLRAQVAEGKQPRELEATLHLISGEIHQARRTPNDLKLALKDYERSVANGKQVSPAVQLRLAQLDVQLGRPDQALARIEKLNALGQGGPSAEHLAVLILEEMGKSAEARARLDKARKASPRSEELVSLAASLLAKESKPKEADRVLAEFLTENPENVGIVLMRAQVLADLLDDLDGARKLLVSVADRSDNSAPLVQLAIIDLRRHDHEAMAATIAKIRGRWKEAAAADLLDAQLALDQGNISDAIAHFDAALKKDPSNKLVQYWKAQLDSRAGATAEAARSLEEIAKDRPTKALDSGQSLMSAAQSALANLALQNGDIDLAINRFEDLRRSGEIGALSRSDRWQLVNAYAAKGEWPAAKNEIAALLNDPKNSATHDERVRAANLFRLHNENAVALAQLDYVLKVNPAHPAAVVTRAYILAKEEKTAEAATILKNAIVVASKDKTRKPPAVFYLMLAAVENQSPPEKDAAGRALAVINQGLEVQPESIELIQAAYRLLLTTKDARTAVAFVESKAKEYPKGQLRRALVEVYREQKDYSNAERLLRELMAESPKDSVLATALVQIAMVEAAQAADSTDRDLARRSDEKAKKLIGEFRAKFPNDLSFIQFECDLAARQGDLATATALTQDMDKIAKNSPAGPLTRARLYAAQGRTREVADSYSEALGRNPRLLDVRIQLGQTELRLGESDEALRQAKLVLEADADQPEAILLEARALATQDGLPNQVAGRRAQAVDRLWAAIKKRPKFSDAYHLIAEIQLKQQQRDEAIATLKKDLAAVPEDGTGLALLVETLAMSRPGGGQKASESDVNDAKAIAEAASQRDTKGNLCLAAAVGFQKADQLGLALPLAEKAVKTLDVPFAHLNYGDLLLAIAEAIKDPAKGRPIFERAIAQYDLVIKAQPRSVEAINNKAWILHTYLGRSKEALALTQGLLAKVDPATLPGEFFDTLGAIQEATGQPREAEESYRKGLRKNPDHAVLNYHMGKLIAADRGRSGKASRYLEKALAGKDHLSPAMASDLASLMAKAGRD